MVSALMGPRKTEATRSSYYYSFVSNKLWQHGPDGILELVEAEWRERKNPGDSAQ
jgi:hypothetical protein